MAAKHSVKVYAKNSYYHVFNRGVEKREIFLDAQDVAVFLSYLSTYLTPKNEVELRKTLVSPLATTREKDEAKKLLQLKNYAADIDLLCYALVKNHFHLLIWQRENVLARFMNSIGKRYGMYFNRKYNRSGVLFQDAYKAVRVESDAHLVELSRYINVNPMRAVRFDRLAMERMHLHSSMSEYVGERRTSWVKPTVILDHFSVRYPEMSYAAFVSLPVDEQMVAHYALGDESG